MSSVKYIRQFVTRFSIEQLTSFNAPLWKSIQNVSVQYYHGSLDYAIAYTVRPSTIVAQTLSSEYDPFVTIYRSIWIHSEHVNLTMLRFPTNFNSWALTLTGALSVASFYQLRENHASEDMQSPNFGKYLIILEMKLSWEYVQSIRKFSSDFSIAKTEQEVILPPFSEYDIDPNYKTWYEKKPHSSIRSWLPVEDHLMFEQPEKVRFYEVRNITSESWDEWFEIMEE